jgi:hypothetical protein
MTISGTSMQQFQGESTATNWVSDPSEKNAKELREVYAHAGLALYCAQCLEHEIVNVLSTLKIADWFITRTELSEAQRLEFENFVDDTWDEAFQQTLGKLIRELAKSGVQIPTNLDSHFLGSLSARNDLAHKFFRSHAWPMMTSEGRRLMFEELRRMQDLFRETDRELHEVTCYVRQKLGITEKAVDDEYRKMREEILADSDRSKPGLQSTD